MPKKPAKPNAFMAFATKFRMEEERRGRRMSINEAVNLAGLQWQKMSAQERAPYEAQAKNERFMAKEPVKFTSQGVPLSLVEQERKEIDDRKKRMNKEILEIVQSSFLNNQIEQEPFYFVAANYFCKNTDGEYIPAEIALSKFTLKDGCVKNYHTYLNPVKLPTGFALKAREYSEAVHRLPQPPEAFGERDWSKVFKAILEFMNCSVVDVPPLFTINDQIGVLQSILKHFCVDASEETETFRVYPLNQLLFEMKKESCKYGLNEDTGFKSIHIADAVLQCDKYDYRSGLACEYHEEEDVSKYCALSMVKRWGFTFVEYISVDTGIELVKGKHLPPDDDFDIDDQKSYISHKSATSSVSSQLTHPIISRHQAQTPSMFSQTTASTVTNLMSENDYPVLGNGRRMKKSRIDSTDADNVEASASGMQFDVKPKREPGMGDPPRNQWSRPTDPRTPSESSLSFNYSHVSQGRGRGLLNDTKPSQGGLSIGRGRMI